MQNPHSELVNVIWTIANQLRGPYRPPQYRRVMLPMIVLRRLDCLIEPEVDKFKAEYDRLVGMGFTGDTLDKALAKASKQNRNQPIYNTSGFTFGRLLADSEGINSNLLAFINGFSPNVRQIFDYFKLEDEIEHLSQSNRLFMVVKSLYGVDLHPERIDNLQMGYVFENLIQKFNEQANEEAGDHFTPREVIHLMTHLMYTGDEDVYTPGIIRSIYDPTCGTGGMLSVSEEYIRENNPNANLRLFGQEYNKESFAICCSDLLIKDEPINNIVFGDTLGDGRTSDGHANKRFHYMLANPPFGVEWKTQSKTVTEEHDNLGFTGRFGPGLPRVNDGSLLFLLHMLSKMHVPPGEGGDGSKIAVVFNGSPLFSGDAGSGESNIRRWIIESDLLDAIIAMPDQLFYNTGISTYIWLLSNRKPEERKGKVMLIDGTRHFEKMRKSMGNKRNEISPEQIDDLVKIYSAYQNEAHSQIAGINQHSIAKILPNQTFGYLKMTVERPLRLNFKFDEERISRLPQEAAFIKLATSKKRKDSEAAKAEIAAGEKQQEAILNVLDELKGDTTYKDRAKFLKVLNKAFKAAEIQLDASLRKAILSALGEQDPEAEICYDSKGNPEPDTDLRDTELVPLPKDVPLPLPIDYDKKASNKELVELMQPHLEAYFEKEVKRHVPDAWIDFSKTKLGYEVPFNQQFYTYTPPRPLAEIEEEMKTMEGEIIELLKEVVQ